jgi:hypothetical protein
MKYYIEKYYPQTVALTLAILFHVFRGQFHDITSLINNLANSTLLVSGTLLGFLLTVITIIRGIDNKPMRFIKQQEGFSLLMQYLRSAIHCNITAISLTIILPFANAFNYSLHLSPIINSLHVFITVLAWATSIRFSIIFIRIIGGS